MPRKTEFPIPTRADECDFLRLVYFAPALDPLAACVSRAYRDLSRTLHGVVRLPDSFELRARASAQVHSALAVLVTSDSSNQAIFDAWHRDSCERLCTTYTESGFPAFCVGQAQKWLNMAFKYAHVFGEECLPGFERLYGLGHVPLDRIMLEKLGAYGAPRLSKPWSRIRDYQEYMHFQ